MLLCASLALALGIGEVLVRQVVHLRDYLTAKLSDDAVLGHRIEPGSNWHGARGLQIAVVVLANKEYVYCDHAGRGGGVPHIFRKLCAAERRQVEQFYAPLESGVYTEFG